VTDRRIISTEKAYTLLNGSDKYKGVANAECRALLLAYINENRGEGSFFGGKYEI